MLKIEIWTDGSCSTNTGNGGWAYLVELNGEKAREESGEGSDTTNNRMELQAILSAIENINQLYSGISYTIYTDSAYICNCFKDKWYERWMANGWRSATKMPVKNRDLWEPLIEEYLHGKNAIAIVKVAGHSNNENNNRVDELARMHKKWEYNYK